MVEVELATRNESPAGATAEARSRARARYNRAMRLVRRAHLYAGLFMTPWVFLYGITALLFNHPDAFPDQEVRRVGAVEREGTPLEKLPKPAELAGRIVAALNAARGDEATGPPYRLVDPGAARFERDLFAVVKGDGDGRQHTVRLDLATGDGTVRTDAAAEPPVKAPFATKGLKLDDPPMERYREGIPPMLARMGLSGGDVTVRLAPGLDFRVEADGRVWQAGYNPQTGALTGRPLDAEGAEALTGRRFLLRLHMAHGYPSQLDARWAWAVAVDLMFASMVGWGITGLLMWWQMKNVRRAGLVVLALSAVAATAVAVGMHAVLAS